MFRHIDRAPARRLPSSRAPRGAVVLHIARASSPNESREERLRLQNDLLRQIEERKQAQRDLLSKLESRSAQAQRSSAASLIDLEEEYRNTLNKFRQTNGEQPATSAAAAPPATSARPVARAAVPQQAAPQAPPMPPQQVPRPAQAPQTAPPQVPRTVPLPQQPVRQPAPPQRAPPPPVPQPASRPPPQVSTSRTVVMNSNAPQPPPPQRAPAAPAAPPVEEVPPPPEEPPLAGENVMNLVFVGAECAPWSKTGGLGDVMGTLPKALARRGHRVMVVVPRYGVYDDAWQTDVRIRLRVWGQELDVGYFHCYKDKVDFLFVDQNCYHNREGSRIYEGSRQDNAFRNALLCKAALEAVWHVPCGGVTYGDSNTCFIANDWHTAMLPVYLQAHYRDYGKMTYARCVLTIHNMAYQGRAPMDELDKFEIPDNYRELFRLYDPVGGEHMNIMKAGIITASRVVAVSGGYAWEIQTPEGGWGLHAVLQEQNWKLSGIVNGIDYSEWHPANDKCLDPEKGYVNYDETSFIEGKRRNKAALQRELGLPEDPDVPLLGFIGRMDYQKGVDLISESYKWIMSQGVQLVLLGSGREDLESALRWMESEHPKQCKSWVGFSVPMAHRITAACDILLMPSRFEPCGLNQLYAMKYGTVPVVHAVGGLRETVLPYNPFENTGTGWTFERAEPEPFRHALGNAMYTFRDYRDSFNQVALRGMRQDLSWDHAAKLYEDIIVAAKYQW